MSTNIDSLNIQITTSAGQAEQKINDLANALSALKSSAGLTKVTNNLDKLAKSISGLNTALAGMNHLDKITRVMDSLKGIEKLTGLSSAINTLKKIPEVVSQLDDTIILRFTTRMEALAKALKPLATEINKVATSFSKLPAQVTRAVTATNKMGSAVRSMSNDIDTGGLNLMSFMSNLEMLWSYAQRVIQVMSDSIATAIEWDGIQYRFGRAFGEDADMVYKHITRINEALGINIQEFMQYSSLYGSLLSGFGLEQEKVTAISVGLTELSYDIWAAYNDRFKSLEQASEAVRSAITGEIEPIRNAGIALTEASLQEYLDQVGMAHISIEKLSEAQKAEVRYAAMVNAAMNQGIVGTYAAEMHTAEGAVRNLSQTLKTLTQAFGSLFIPVLQLVIPYLSAFVELLVEAVHWVASLFGIELFAIDWSAPSAGAAGLADGMGDVATGADNATSGLKDAANAAKKLKDYAMGFDELNVIQPPSESAAGAGKGGLGADAGIGSSGLLDLESLWDESVFNKVSNQVDELKEKLRGFWDEWKEEIAIIAGLLGALGIAKLLGHLGEALQFGNKFAKVMNGVAKLAAAGIVVTLQYSIQHELFKGFIDGEGFKKYLLALLVGALGTGVLYSMFGPAGIVIGLAVTAAASLSATFEDGKIDSWEEALTGLTGLASAAGALALAWPKIKPALSGIREFFAAAKVMAPEVGWLAALFPKASMIISTASTWVTGTLVPAVSSAIMTGLGAVASFLGVSVGWAAAIVAAVIAAIVGAFWVATHWEEVKTFFVETVPEWFSGVKDAVTDWWSKFDLGEIIRNAMSDAKEWFSGVRDRVIEAWDEIVQKIDNIDWAGLGEATGRKVGAAFRKAKEWFVGVGDAVKEFFLEDLPKFFKEDIPRFFEETIPQTIEKIKEGWNKFWKEKVPEFLGDMVNFFFVELPTWVEEMKEIGTEIIMGVLTGIKNAWNEFWKGVGEWIDGFVKGFKEELGIHSPSKVFADIGVQIIAGLLNGISQKWEDLKSWYKRVVAPKFTKEYWKTTFDTIVVGLKTKLDEAWEKVKSFFDVNEWKKKVVDAMDAIKKNFKIPELPKIRLEVTWDTNVGAVKTAVYQALGLSGWPRLSWSAYAAGGFPNMGEMFIAREAGPELVGRIGAKSAVVNNDQIVAAVSQGVYSAMVAAMNGNTSNGAQNVNVYLDGRQIYASVKKTESERGLSLMGSQLGYAY